jgi:predicted permease
MNPSQGERWYERLLRLYPSDFRDRFGREMTRLYRDRRRAESGWRLWCSLIVDVLKTAPSEHWSMLRQDLRDAWRSLRRTPIVTATAAMTLALGIGASTAMFTVVHGVLLRPLPYREPDRLVELSENNLATGAQMRASLLNYLSWAEQSQSLEAIAAFQSIGTTLTGSGDPEPLSGLVVTPSLFRVLGVGPLVGRGLQDDDERRGSPRVVVLGEALWRSRFGADRQIAGRSITLDGERYEIVGVVPRTFRDVGRSQIGAPAAPQIFLPISIDRARENRGNHTLLVAGRLRSGVGIEQAREEMRAVAAALALEFPATNANWSVRLDRLSDTMHDPQVRRSLILMLGAVAMAFLIGCGNVANLLLVRGANRGAELALRTALGAGRPRLMRQLLTESACLSGVSGAAGVLTAAVAHPLILGLLPPTLPRVDEMHVDAGLLAAGLVVSIVSGLGFGLVPALTASRLDPSRSLTSAGRASTGAPRGRMRQTLIAGQVALSTMLLIAAALLLQALVRLQHVPLGFDGDAVWTSRISLPRGTYSDAARMGQFYQRVLTALAGSGHVESAAITTSAPFAPGVRAGFQVDRGLRAPGNTPTDLTAAEHIVSHDYFRVLRIPVVGGRSFTEQDRDGSTAVAVVSQRFARNVWPDTDPIGKTLERAGRTYEVVGIVGDVRGSDVQGPRGGGADREPRAAVYLPAG